MVDNILLVSSDIKTQSIFKDLFASSAYTLHTASGISRGKNSVFLVAPEILFLDRSVFPAEKCRGFLSEIRKSNPGIWTVLLENKTGIDDAVECWDEFTCDIIEKPVSASSLTLAVKRAEMQLKNTGGKPVSPSVDKLITSERLSAVSQLIEGLSSFVKNISDDLQSGVRYFNEMPCFISVHDKNMNLLSTNALYSKNLGNMVGARSWEVYLDETTGPDNCPVAKTIKTGRSQRCRETLACLSGNSRPVVVHTAPIKNRAGETELVLEMAVDLREIKRLKKELQMTQMQYELLFNEAPCYVTVHDRDFTISAANRRFKEDFGDVTGRKCFDVYRQKNDPCSSCSFHSVIQDSSVCQSETTVTGIDNQEYNLLTWMSPLRDNKGDVSKVIVMSTNVTEIKKLQGHLTSLGLMIGSMSHGIKGLLTGLDGGIYFMESGFRNNNLDEIEEGWEAVKHISERIKSLVLDILYYVKKRDLQWSLVEVKWFAEDIRDHIKNKMESHGILFNCRIEEGLGFFEIDTSIVRSAIVNILENAIDACMENRSTIDHKIDFHVSDEKDKIIFRISDNGMGMDETTRKNMFTIFFSSKGKKGTGLGMFISNKIILQHNGSIHVESEPNRGSCFTISLPKRLSDSAKSADSVYGL